MIIALIGASSSGKSLIEKKLSEDYKFEKIVSYTTRTSRPNEINGKDYFFITNQQFEKALNDNLFAEYEEYSYERLYGTVKSDYTSTDNKVVVLTPNGFRQICKNCGRNNIFAIYVKSNLGNRVQRYIERCGVNNFNYEDMEEISSRVNRDFGMLLGIEREVDLVINNDKDTDIDNLVKEIIECVNQKRKK